MTPQLQQAIRLLQLSSMELETEIQDALESNMMLELDDDHAAQSNAAEASEDNREAAESAGGDDFSENAADVHSSETETGLNQDNIPNDLRVDSAWEDIYDASTSYSRRA